MRGYGYIEGFSEIKIVNEKKFLVILREITGTSLTSKACFSLKYSDIYVVFIVHKRPYIGLQVTTEHKNKPTPIR